MEKVNYNYDYFLRGVYCQINDWVKSQDGPRESVEIQAEFVLHKLAQLIAKKDLDFDLVVHQEIRKSYL